MRIALWFEQFAQDLRAGAKGLWHSPGFSIAAVLSLALGIGATTVIFSVIYGVVIDPFPYSHPETLMSMAAEDPAHHARYFPYMPDQYLDFVEQNHIFEALIASTISDVLLTGNGEPERLRGNFVTTNTFEVMGVKPYLGRYITQADAGTPAAPVAVLGYKFWRRHFGDDPHVLGRNLRLNDKVRTIVGVMPPRFMWRGADVYLPITFERGKFVEDVRYINVIGRLKPGVTAAQADTGLHPIFDEILSKDPSYHHQKFHVKLYNFYETYPSSIRTQLWTLFAAVSLLLLIACVNVSNLMLSRAAARSRDLAVRASLGAGRLRIARQLLTESLLIAIGAGVLGVLLAVGGLYAVIAVIPPDTIPDESKVSLNVPVLIFTLALAVFTALLFGLAPALQSARTDLTEALKASGRTMAGSLREGRLRKTLVGAEVALAVMLLVGASLVLRTLLKLQEMNWGFRPAAVLSMQLPLPERRYPALNARNAYLKSVVERVESLPGIERVALNTFVHPFANWGTQVEVPGLSLQQQRPVILSQINSSYPDVVGLRLKEGREFTAQEVLLRRHLVVVNETFARQYFKDGKVLGRSIRLPELKGAPVNLTDDSFEIAGVVNDLRNVGLQRETYPEVYIPYTTTGFLESYIHPMLLVSSRIPAQELANAIRDQIHSLDPDQAIMQVETVDRLLDNEGFAEPRFSVFLFSIFAGLGLLLSAIGIYGVINYSVSSQLPGLGVRIALGAMRKDILALVLRDGIRLVASGILMGLAASLLTTRLLRSLIWGVSPFDPLSFLSVTVVLAVVGLAACLWPAWRASRVDPMIVLRYE
jgi:putative ABC transport system permease protein